MQLRPVLVRNFQVYTKISSYILRHSILVLRYRYVHIALMLIHYAPRPIFNRSNFILFQLQTTIQVILCYIYLKRMVVMLFNSIKCRMTTIPSRSWFNIPLHVNQNISCFIYLSIYLFIFIHSSYCLSRKISDRILFLISSS